VVIYGGRGGKREVGRGEEKVSLGRGPKDKKEEEVREEKRHTLWSRCFLVRSM